MSALFGLLLAAQLQITPNPTRPDDYRAGAGGAPLASLVLDSTLTGGRVPVAILNGHLYPLGSQIGPYRLIAVGAGWVILGEGSKRLRLVIGSSTNPNEEK
ncbi:MAG: hypothetical protein WCY91_00075 [Acidithiobacillus sp.]|uniref:hypothetical protein n=1 Tax=Acidithiobacillus sp. TaxID=1872118 RepID=UPI00356A4B0A